MDRPSRHDGAFAEDLFADLSARASASAGNVCPPGVFLNAYAEASQASPSRKRRLPIDPADTVAIPIAEKHEAGREEMPGEQIAETIDPSATARAEPVDTKPEPARQSSPCPQAPETPRMMTAGDVAAYLGISLSKVWRLEKRINGFPKPVRIDGSTRWDRWAIDHFIDSLQAAGPIGR